MPDLVGQVDNKAIADELYEKRAVNREEYETVVNERHTHKQSRVLFSIINRKVASAYEHFLEYIERNENSNAIAYRVLTDIGTKTAGGKCPSMLVIVLWLVSFHVVVHTRVNCIARHTFLDITATDANSISIVFQ